MSDSPTVESIKQYLTESIDRLESASYDYLKMYSTIRTFEFGYGKGVLDSYKEILYKLGQIEGRKND